jgi:LacI family transcriptional regulator
MRLTFDIQNVLGDNQNSYPKRFGSIDITAQIMRITLKDIADKSGFSITTVSRALGGYDDVNEETRQHIVNLAISMGYEPNQVARQLRHQRTNTIGMIIPANDQVFSDDFFSELMMGVGHAASVSGFDLLLSAQTSPENEMAAYRRMVGGRRVDGVVVARTRRDDSRIDYLKQLSFPFVVSGRNALGQPSDFPYVDVDSQLGIKMMVHHLVELGHRDIGLLLPPPEMAFTPYRLKGYQDGLAEAGLRYDESYTYHGNLKRSGGYDAALQLLSTSPRITALIACNDLMAFGAIRAIQEQGLQVGVDVAVSGFDDIAAAEYSTPPLTTIRQPIYEIGQRLFEMLLRIIQGQTPEETQIVLEPSLAIRDSCGSSQQ